MTRARQDVRNPVAASPEVAAIIGTLTPNERKAIEGVLRVLSREWQRKAQECWTSHKGPMALYNKVNAVNARHLALAMKRGGV